MVRKVWRGTMRSRGRCGDEEGMEVSGRYRGREMGVKW